MDTQSHDAASVLDAGGIDPDDAFSTIPYEKGEKGRLCSVLGSTACSCVRVNEFL